MKYVGLIIAFVFSLLTIFLLYDDYADNRLPRKKYILISVLEGLAAIGAMILMLV